MKRIVTFLSLVLLLVACSTPLVFAEDTSETAETTETTETTEGTGTTEVTETTDPSESTGGTESTTETETAEEVAFEAAAEHAIVVEANTGQILYAKDATTADGIASITKILTAYLVYEAIAEGTLSLDTQVAISDYAYNLTLNSEASNVPLEARSYTVEQLLNASLVASANSAAIALAEHIGGSEPAFVDMMKAKVEEWGITDATIVNASGLNNSMLGENIYPDSSSDDENLMSAKDVAIIAQHLIQDYPQVLQITSQTTYNFAGTDITTWNYMLAGYPYYREGITGLKTGTTALAGPSFVATSTENGIPVIAVILNADNADSDSYARFSATYNLLDYIANNFATATLVEAGDRYEKSTATVIDGKEESVTAIAKEDLTYIQAGDSETPTATFSTNEEGYKAAVSKGDTVGTLTLDLSGDQYLSGVAPTVEMVAKNSVERSNALKVWWNHFVKYVNEKL